jgi:hypothetical protein
MKYAVIAVSLLLALAGRASAQPGMTPAVPAEDVADEPPGWGPPPPAPAPVMGQVPDPELAPVPVRVRGSWRSGSMAFLLSLGGTAVSWGVMLNGADQHFGATNWVGLAGMTLAPSFGSWYADRYFTRGLGLRVGSLAAIVVGAALAGDSLGFDYGYDHGETQEEVSSSEDMGGVLVLVGVLGFVIGTIDDIVSAPVNVRERNRELGYGLALAPVVTQHSTGFALGGRF